MFINKPFILASSSQSRYKILKNTNLKFTVIKPLCDEEDIKKKLNKKTKPKQTAKVLAEEKARSVSIKKPNKLVVGCDTVLIFEKKAINKAKNTKEAFLKIKKLSGKKHIIFSAISVFKNNKKIWSHQQSTKIKIRKIKDKDIKNYLKKTGKQILRSVGCYQVELLGPTIIEDIEGDFFNVMGLPLFPFLKFIKKP